MKRNLEIYYGIWLISLYALEAAVRFPPSPCPGMFCYEDESTDGNIWYGGINLASDVEVTGFTLRITLDRPSQLLASWEGNVISNDNKVYVVIDPLQKLLAQTTVRFRIMVKYNHTNSEVPLLKSIHFNARKACPPDPALILSAVSQYETGDNRPDLDITEPTDIISELSETIASVYPSPRPAPVQTSSKCGQVDIVTPLITHGAPTYRGQWPWHVALYRAEGVDLKYNCGGTIVSKTKVITAAHCVTNGQGNAINANSLVLYFGKYKLSQYSDEVGVQIKQVSRIHVYPEYNTYNYYGDIAVLILSTPIEYNNFVKPICLWTKSAGSADIVGKQGSVVGWGLDESDQATQDLRVAHMPVVSSETCLRSFPHFYAQYTSNSTFCAGFSNGTNACNGDSGGGFVINIDATWYLRGIVSLSVAKEGLNFCDPKYYVIFADVSMYQEFINRYVPDY